MNKKQKRVQSIEKIQRNLKIGDRKPKKSSRKKINKSLADRKTNKSKVDRKRKE